MIKKKLIKTNLLIEIIFFSTKTNPSNQQKSDKKESKIKFETMSMHRCVSVFVRLLLRQQQQSNNHKIYSGWTDCVDCQRQQNLMQNFYHAAQICLFG